MAASGGSFGFTPVADNTKNVGANVALIAAGAGVSQTITPTVPQAGANVINLSSNWIRVGWTPNAGITMGGAAANRVTLVPPIYSQWIDFGDSAGDVSTSAVDTIASVTVIAVAAPTATTEAGAIAAATTAVAGSVVFNWLTT